MMESENQSDSVETQVETTAEDTMAPLESELGDKSQESQENVPNVKVKQMEAEEGMGETGGSADEEGEVDDGEAQEESGAADAEDGELLEDGEIASDQDGEIEGDDQEETKDERSDSSKTSPSKRHHDDHGRRGHSKKDRHNKRRRSKEDAHKENRQKKKRHRDHGDYDKSDESGWGSDGRRDKSDRKRDRSSRSPGHDDSDKRRRGSGENRHHGRDRDNDREKIRSSRHDKRSDRHDKSDKKDRDRHGRDKDRGKNYSDGYDSPPGIYDSPSDEDYDGFDKGKAVMEDQEDYMDPSMADVEMEIPKNKNKKQQKRKKDFDRAARRDRQEEKEGDQPPKKKPLLQTPMEERPICKFFKEGKCQKGSDCPFNHDYQPQKRLELCKYYVQSYCKRDGCMFLHEEFPCKYYHTGSTCYQGDTCKFSHAPLTQETEMALQNMLKEKEDFYVEEEWEGNRKQHKKKGLLGDGPGMTDEEIQFKLEKMKSIPSIFDIQTHAPGESPIKPKPNKQQNMGGMPGQGFFPDNMSPQTSQGGPNVRFPGPVNQNAPNRPPFMGPGGPGMDGPPMGMVPPIVSGPGMMGQGPPPMMAGPGAPGMQGQPLGPPMSQAAALVGAILRAAPMLQQYRGPSQQVPITSMSGNMPSDPRFMGSNMDGSNMAQGMNSQNMMGPGMNPVMGAPVMNQDTLMTDMQKGMMGDDNMVQGQNQDFNMLPQTNQINGPNNTMGAGGSVRDPRKAGAQNDPRLHKGGEASEGDLDMRSGSNKMENHGDEDLRQDVDMRQEDGSKNKGDSTPTQNWDDNEGGDDDDDMEIPSHLPPKQREMFMRIKQHTMKMKREKSELFQQQKKEESEPKSDIKLCDEKWYSSDEEDEKKPNINNILNSLSKPNEIKSEVTSSPVSTSQSSFNVMQMINAIKSQPSTNNRAQDPRKATSQQKTVQETVYIQSQDGDCPWRLCRVLYVKNRIPSNIDLNEAKYKNDPRVQKILKLQELESGKVIDHTKSSPVVRSDSYSDIIEPKIPDLLDPKVFKAKEASMPRPELAPFIDPRGAKGDQEVGLPRQLDPRMKSTLSDPRVQNKLSVPGAGPGRPLDPRLSRQDSNSSSSSSAMPSVRPFDPWVARQSSQDSPPLDPRMMNRQSSNDPRLPKSDMSPDISGIAAVKPADPRLAKVLDSEINQMAFQRPAGQLSPTASDKEVTNSDASKKKIDYRNDPRFKRKHISESNLSPETVGKRYTGQRKSSTEYSSPLGEMPATQEQSGYNSYNRPRPQKPQTQSQAQTPSVTKTEIIPSNPDISTHDILDSLQIMPPPDMGGPQQPDKNLKDIFKTIDPTASPFC